jgi:hypothetical protein
VHGVFVVPALHRLFATATALHQVVTIDTRTDRVLTRTSAGIVPDGIAYDPVARQVFVSDEPAAGALTRVRVPERASRLYGLEMSRFSVVLALAVLLDASHVRVCAHRAHTGRPPPYDLPGSAAPRRLG